MTPEAKRDTLIKRGANIEVSVKEKAIHQSCQQSPKEMVAGHFGVTTKQIRIVSGHHSCQNFLALKPTNKKLAIKLLKSRQGGVIPTDTLYGLVELGDAPSSGGTNL